jgi:uncharacterized protein
MPPIKIHHTDTSDAAWDGPAAKANLKNDAEEAYYRKAFAWEDPDGDPKTKKAYKFIHHEVGTDGAIGAANLKGCQAGCGVLNGAMGGANIPDGDRQGVYDHLAAHLKDADVTPPELNSLNGSEKESQMERRFTTAELRASTRDDKQPVIEGLAAVYEQETDLYWFREIIRKGAFDRVLSENPDVVAAFNHNWDKILGRTLAGTLHLTDSPTGLLYATDINVNDSEAMSVYAKVQRKDIRQSSFAFTVRKDEWTYPEEKSTEMPLRTIVEIGELFDVSPVTFPAYPQTSANVRSKLKEFTQIHSEEGQEVPTEPEAAADPQVRNSLLRKRLELEEKL